MEQIAIRTPGQAAARNAANDFFGGIKSLPRPKQMAAYASVPGKISSPAFEEIQFVECPRAHPDPEEKERTGEQMNHQSAGDGLKHSYHQKNLLCS